MRYMKVVVGLVFLTAALWGLQSKANETGLRLLSQTGPTPALEEEKVKKSPRLEEFVGKWTGKWDGTFHVQFTISPVPGDAESLNVIYEWEEFPGHALNRRELTGKINGNVLAATGSRRLIDILLVAGEENGAQAYGHFAQPRRANLTREKGASGVR